MTSQTIKSFDEPILPQYFQVSLGIIVRIKKRLETCKRHQSKHLDLTIPAFEAEGREFESLRARRGRVT